ncbi:MAG: N-acetylneuraminate synthase [Bacteroidales bacterium]|nr:N-acetylneuraminate synthase [Bacteroidales bacterium]
MGKTLIIAEAGVNHNGSEELAFKMVDEASKAGADIIKFQTFTAKNLVNKKAHKAEYQQKNCGKQESQYEMLSKLELPYDTFVRLKDYCQQKGIIFISTPFDIEGIDFLRQLEMKYMKIPSGEITNLPYLRAVGSSGIPVIMSTGMCNIGDVEASLNILYSQGMSKEDITLLHCNTEYPTPMQDVNLRVMATLRDAFGVKVGYSDHTKGIEVPIAAVALGASVIEKHFTLDRSLPGPDHKASITPKELKEMVKSIRNIEIALGSGIKKISDSEQKNIAIARKSIVAKRPIKKGEIYTEDNLTVKRPGDGISPMLWDNVLGRISYKDFDEDDKIEV